MAKGKLYQLVDEWRNCSDEETGCASELRQFLDEAKKEFLTDPNQPYPITEDLDYYLENPLDSLNDDEVIIRHFLECVIKYFGDES